MVSISGGLSDCDVDSSYNYLADFLKVDAVSLMIMLEGSWSFVCFF